MLLGVCYSTEMKKKFQHLYIELLYQHLQFQLIKKKKSCAHFCIIFSIALLFLLVKVGLVNSWKLNGCSSTKKTPKSSLSSDFLIVSNSTDAPCCYQKLINNKYYNNNKV